MLGIPLVFLLPVKAWVDVVDVFLVQPVLGKAQPLASTGRVEWRNGAANTHF